MQINDYEDMVYASFVKVLFEKWEELPLCYDKAYQQVKGECGISDIFESDIKLDHVNMEDNFRRKEMIACFSIRIYKFNKEVSQDV